MSTNPLNIIIFLSSPKDTAREKKIVRKVCQELNETFLEAKLNVYFFCRDWEGILEPIGPKPQKKIDLEIDNYGMYIGILKGRLGTPPDIINPNTGLPFASGTEREYYDAYQRYLKDNNFPIHLFVGEENNTSAFSSNEEKEQANALHAFVQEVSPHNFIRPFKKKNFKQTVYKILNAYGIRRGKQQFERTENGSNRNQTTEKSNIDLSALINGATQTERHIPRTFTSLKAWSEKTLSFLFKEDEGIRLEEIINQANRIVVLGNAGSGKSVELQDLAIAFLDVSQPLIAIYRNMKYYVDEPIEDFLPHGWKEVDENSMLIILDGLDEVPQQYFETATRRISSFAETHPEARIVVSCRTNFYTFPSNSSTGSLPDFSCYFIDDLTPAEVSDYLTERGISPKEQEILTTRHDTQELLANPFFLSTIADVCKTNRNFKLSKANILKLLLEQRIVLDKKHYSTKKEIEQKKAEILDALQRIAFVMEATGRNSIPETDCLKVVGNIESFSLLKYTTAFVKSEENNEWMFEHKSIQEYLSATLLLSKGFKDFRKLVSLRNGRLKPNWLNTLSFIASIDEEGEFIGKTYDWLLKSDREVLVKFEADRILEPDRIKLFKSIFNHYKNLGTRIFSNKFSISELAEFGNSTSIQKFLLAEMSDPNAALAIRYDAVKLLLEIKSSYYPGIREKLESRLVELILAQIDPYFTYYCLTALCDLEYYNEKSIDIIVSKFRSSKNGYIRSGLYQLLISSRRVDKYIEVFVDGANLSALESDEPRTNSNFYNETRNLVVGLSSVKSREGIVRVLQLITNREHRNEFTDSDLKEISNSLVNNAISLNDNGLSLKLDFEQALSTFIRYSETEAAEALSDFFEQTGTLTALFLQTLRSVDLQPYETYTTLGILINNTIIEELFELYKKRDLTNDDIRLLHSSSFHVRKDNKRDLHLQIEKLAADNGLHIPPIQKVDFSERKQQFRIKSFNLLFSPSEFREAVNLLFDSAHSPSLKLSDIYSINREGKSIDQITPTSVIRVVRGFENNGIVSHQEVDKWINNTKLFTQDAITQIYEYLRNHEEITPTEEQINFIDRWVRKTFKKTNIKNAITAKSEDGQEFSYTYNAVYLWYFLRKFNINLPEKKLLDFTLFYSFEPSLFSGAQQYEFEYLERIMGEESVKKQVSKNLKNSRNLINYVWEANATYAIEKGFSDADIISELKNTKRYQYSRDKILRKYYEKNKNRDVLFDILSAIGYEEITWTIIDLLLKDSHDNQQLIHYLNSRLNSKDLIDNKLTAAKYLMRLNQLSGLEYFIANRLSSRQPRDSRIPTFGRYDNPSALPLICRALELSLTSKTAKEPFNELQGLSLDALRHFAITSEENLMASKKHVATIVSKYPSANFLHSVIQDAEDTFYLNMSINTSIEQAITALDSL